MYQSGNMYGSPARSSRKTLFIVVGAVIVLGLVIFLISRACAATSSETAQTASQQAAMTAADQTERRVSFVAVGDNLPNDNIGAYADSLAGETGDDVYDYKPIFAPIKSIVEKADLAYIDQETVIGGSEIGARGWPSFNTTDEMADAVVDAGFDFVATATNHAYEWGPFGATEHSSQIWDSKPVAWTGTAATKEQYDRLATLESNGIKFALLNYTYGVNSYEKEDLPEYAVNLIDRDRMATDVARAKEEADVVLVAMHWGTEYSTETNEEQESLAQFLADMDVDVILGSHPHVIEPMKWVSSSKEGSEHRTLVAYSLGNFICDFDEPSGIHLLEGMLSCDFVKKGEDISLENIVWTPIICHYNTDRSEYAVYTVDDYTADLAKQNPVFAEEDDPQAWIRDTTKSIVGDEWFETKA